MSKSANFQSAVVTVRPRGMRVIEAYSPKLGRRLQCFGEHVFGQWIRLEADPSVQTFCERPVYLDLAGKRLADFWVRQDDREMLIVVDDESPTSTITIGNAELEIFSIAPAELAAARIWIGNWERMLPAMTACRQQITPSFQQSILKFIREPMQISRIEQEFGTGEPTLVRAAVFNLLHNGKVQAPQLHTEPLSFLTCFQPARSTS
jgi:hypothetical protein